MWSGSHRASSHYHGASAHEHTAEMANLPEKQAPWHTLTRFDARHSVQIHARCTLCRYHPYADRNAGFCTRTSLSGSIDRWSTNTARNEDSRWATSGEDVNAPTATHPRSVKQRLLATIPRPQRGSGGPCARPHWRRHRPPVRYGTAHTSRFYPLAPSCVHDLNLQD